MVGLSPSTAPPTPRPSQRSLAMLASQKRTEAHFESRPVWLLVEPTKKAIILFAPTCRISNRSLNARFSLSTTMYRVGGSCAVRTKRSAVAYFDRSSSTSALRTAHSAQADFGSRRPSLAPDAATAVWACPSDCEGLLAPAPLSDCFGVEAACWVVESRGF